MTPQLLFSAAIFLLNFIILSIVFLKTIDATPTPYIESYTTIKDQLLMQSLERLDLRKGYGVNLNEQEAAEEKRYKDHKGVEYVRENKEIILYDTLVNNTLWF